ncbi:MAG TPA: hypothetical protein PKH33_01335 [bacterium]|nr:hypothetical protein [bacterium]
MPEDASYCANCGANTSTGAQSGIEQGIVNNDSVPEGIKGFNFGALVFNWIWAFSHKLWLYGVLSLIFIFVSPFSFVGSVLIGNGLAWLSEILFVLDHVLTLVLLVILAFKGNELAWKAGKFNSIEVFKNTQRAWIIAGIVVCVIVVAMGIFVLTAFQKSHERHRFQRCVSALSGMRVAEEMYISDNGTYTDNIDYLSMYMIQDCKEPDGSDCVGQLLSRIKENCAGDDTNLKISVSYGLDYQITGSAGDRHNCQICMTPQGYTPSDYSKCSPHWIADCSTIGE